ncbi:hypothetical protein GE09DRAFT_1288139 [Coniochaeta sp. 2T2.1]|nr:hypothetical protein GE09DRAFT_1288139 [Coniochaeta sp. 2T2.1]
MAPSLPANLGSLTPLSMPDECTLPCVIALCASLVLLVVLAYGAVLLTTWCIARRAARAQYDLEEGLPESTSIARGGLAGAATIGTAWSIGSGIRAGGGGSCRATTTGALLSVRPRLRVWRRRSSSAFMMMFPVGLYPLDWWSSTLRLCLVLGLMYR